MRIEFDPAKNGANIRDRGLGFERAAEFDFGTAVIERDTRKPYPEPRFVAVGFLDARLHVLCFTPVAGGIRVISFRRANAREVRDYEQTRSID
ncbi:MAG: BrnT family toxin [Acidovorax sp.]|uniref:BrnT family toxin n=1 Tax=Acidovorax sp. TaxID=1872122 RepID=UPI0039E45156